MNQILIGNYIRKLTKQDVVNFLDSQNIFVSDKEVDILYHYIKTRYKEFLAGNHQGILEELKSKVSPATYSKILEYYVLYQDKL